MGGKKRGIMRFLGAVLATGMLFAIGCGGMTQVVSREKISEGEKAIKEAKASNASLNAPAELVAAEEKLNSAKEMILREEYDAAYRLADEATVDAEYARAKATTEKNRKTAEEMRKNIQILRQEIERRSR